MTHYYLYQSAGDIILAMPAIRAKSGGGVIINGLPIKVHSSLKLLIDEQSGFTLEHESIYGVPRGTINLEGFRYLPNWKYQHIALSFAEILGVKIDLSEPWLQVDGWQLNPIVNTTDRYRDRFFNWGTQIHRVTAPNVRTLFIGELKDYVPYKNICHYIGLPDFLLTAQYLKNAMSFSANQSACLAIAQGLGIPYNMQISPSCPGTAVTGRANEAILNRHTWKLHFIGARIKEMFKIIFK